VNVVETVQAVRSAGGSVSVSGGSLIVDAPPELPAIVWDALAIHKATLIDLLAPVVTYADLAAQEEREAIQAEAEAPAETAFDLPRPARRCRLLRDAEARDPHRGLVKMPAGIEGWVVGLDEIGDGLARINLDWNMSLARRDGHAPVIVLIDGRPRVLEAASVEVLPEEGESL
jgi:hypothetical protein